MMNIGIFLIIFTLTLGLSPADFVPVAPGPSEKSGTIHLLIENLEPSSGYIMIALHNGAASFPGGKEPWLLRQIPMTDADSFKIDFEEIPYGEYAISIYQDLNENQKLDTGLFGIPKEPWGMSNNPKPLMRAPKFSEAAFKMDRLDLQLSIRLF